MRALRSILIVEDLARDGRDRLAYAGTDETLAYRVLDQGRDTDPDHDRAFYEVPVQPASDSCDDAMVHLLVQDETGGVDHVLSAFASSDDAQRELHKRAAAWSPNSLRVIEIPVRARI